MKLNIGCGFRHMDGFVNVDSFEKCNPDVLWDLEETPWPFEDNSASEIQAIHVLEHLGADYKVFAKIIQEIYRVLEPGGVFYIEVPHFTHYSFHSDPTHVRSFTPTTFQMLSKKQNEDWVARDVNMTMLALALDVDFEVDQVQYAYDAEWTKKLKNGEISKEEIRILAHERWGVIKELRVRMRACKD